MTRVAVIGAGVDELAAAHLLARAGRQVVVIEETGGSADVAGWVPPQIVRELGLSGFQIEAPDPWISIALPEGGRLDLSRDMGRSVEAIRRVSPADAQTWPAFCTRMATLARLLEELYLAPPPDPTSLGVVLKVRRLGRQGMEDLMRLLPMPAAEWLDEWFECDALKGALGALAVMHIQQGPRSGGTGFRLLHHHVGSPPGVFRPARSNIRKVLRELGGIEVRRAEAARITVRDGRVTGVVLASGEEVEATLVLSGADPQRTLLELADPGWLDPELARSVRHIRRRGVAARISLAYEGKPPFSNLTIAPSLDYLERAYDDSKYGRISARPYVEARVDGPRIEVHCQYAPYRLANGEWDASTRTQVARQAVNILAEHLPNIAGAVPTVLAPPDLQTLHAWPEGQPYHAELALDQALWMRPLPELARYRTPIEGLWLCGPAMHPGGGILGASGRNAARGILRAT